MKSFLLIISILIWNNFFAQDTISVNVKIPEDILKRCNQSHIIKYYTYDSLHQIDISKLYLYFEDSHIDTIPINDSVPIDDESTCSSTNIKVPLDKMKLAEGKIYLLNNNGELMYSLPFDDILFLSNNLNANITFSPNCGYPTFDGIGESEDLYLGFKTKEENLAYITSLTHDKSLLIVQLGNKFGLLDLEGNLVEDIIYDKIEFDTSSSKLTLFSNGLIVKKIRNKIF